MEKIATDTYSFEDLRKGGFVYVDKTAILKQLADGSIGKQFFIARPRRFGKSLAVSTLQCLFEGRRDLFQGLAIESDWDWTKTYPVLHLDMGSCQAATVDELWRKINTMLKSEAERLGVGLRADEPISGKFQFLISDLAKRNCEEIVAAAKARGEEPPLNVKGQMVLLVDEYDKPLLGHLGRPDVNDICDALKEFYSVIKTCEGQQRFAFITGVSKFSKVSIFSDLNNLNEFSMDARFATLFGYTHEEVKANFPGALAALGVKQGVDAEGTFAELVKWYDGYRFHHESVPVFNPVSVGKCLATSEMKAYQSLFYAVFVLIGARTYAECWTNRGRADAVVETPCGIYVFEFKLGSGAPGGRALPTYGSQDGRAVSMKPPSLAIEVLAQIKDKGYAEKYLRRGKKVTLVGAAFDAEMRNLSDRAIEVAK